MRWIESLAGDELGFWGRCGAFHGTVSVLTFCNFLER
jgi:hypothetical protein